ncbi:endonuclease domain-containing protein [Phenylobacterium terrae]|uniref:Endonuclease domain-containing protein n=1 Tax=Phenylobacterium terrae TaxID=2665495 RepID=A0ABW4N425_9CAUL
MSSHEVRLWSRLKRLRERGFHIRRQAPFRGYFLDFVCFSRRLVIEVDGSQHQDEVQADHDLVRDRILAREGFRTLRLTTGQINEDIGAVMDTIVFELEARPDFPTRPRAARGSTLPMKGREGRATLP